MAENECLLATDLVAVSDIYEPFPTILGASYQISYRTEVAATETDDIALVNAKLIFAQAFALCEQDSSCLESVQDTIEFPSDIASDAEELVKYTEDSTILWKINDILQLSPSFSQRLQGSDCDVDCYNANCEICELELEIQTLANGLGQSFQNAFVIDYIKNTEIDKINFQVEFEAHENTKSEVTALYTTWLGDISESELLAGGQSSDIGYVGVLKNPSEILWETIEATDFIDTVVDTYSNYCFAYNEGGSECKLKVQTTLESVWVSKKNDECIAKGYELDVVEKDADQLWCRQAHNGCDGCNTDCTITEDDMYRAEYNIKLNIRSDTRHDTENRFLITGQNWKVNILTFKREPLFFQRYPFNGVFAI